MMSTRSVVSLIAKRLQQDESSLNGLAGDHVGGRFEFLRNELNLVEALFEDADGFAVSQDAERRACQLAYDIEDAVEHQIILHHHRNKNNNNNNNVICTIGAVAMRSLCPRASVDGDIISKIRELKQLLLAIIASEEPEIAEFPDYPFDECLRNLDPVIVGMDYYADKLLSVLLEGTRDRLVIPICGIGGMGKTTLAHHVYNSDLVQSQFQNRAWVCVSQVSQPRDILETMLSCLLQQGSSSDKIAKMETMELMEELFKSQRGKRYVVVLDDVWSLQDWDAIKYAFPDDHNGSRVIITTRKMDLARYVAATYVVEMRPLTESEGWELLKNKSGLVAADEEDHSGMQEIDPEIEKIGQQIVKYCGGLPFALTVIGFSLLGRSARYWEAMLHSLEESNTPVVNLEAAEDILALISYHHLQSHQKPCFLYLGQFPHDKIISPDTLYSLWMADGVILQNGRYGETQMQVAQGYLNDLVGRNLVIAYEEGNVEVSILSSSLFRVNDLMRDFCISKGKQEGFYEVIDFRNRDNKNMINSLSSRRLAVYLDRYSPSRKDTYGDALSNFTITEPKHIRSILFFDKITIDDHESIVPEPTQPKKVWTDLTKFQWTRVLGFDGVDFRVKNLLMGIEKLIYLRYLSFFGCYLHEFPTSLISNSYYFLETLDLRVSFSCSMIIPNVLNKLSMLRHLYFPLEFRSSKSCDKLKIENLKMLEVLENFHTGVCDSGDLLHLKNLRVFTGFVDGNNTDLKNVVTCLDMNMRERHLDHSSLVVNNFDTYSKKRQSIVKMTLESASIYVLKLEGHLGEFTFCGKFGSNLRDIVFNGSEFHVDPMPILGKLLNLRSLVLCDDAFVGKEIVLGCGSDFPQLTSLKLATLQYLERWEVKTREGEDEMQLMPKLVRLSIEQCVKLETLPSQLGNVTTLKEFMIGLMPQEFQKKVGTMVQEMQMRFNTKAKVTFYD